MRASLLVLAMLPAAAAAQDATRHAWGAPVEDSSPSVVSVEPCDPPCVAVVRFDNTLVSSGQPSPVPMHTTLALGDLPIAVTVEQGGGLLPDLLRVRPPLGYVAEPHEAWVDDNSSHSVRVVPVPMS